MPFFSKARMGSTMYDTAFIESHPLLVLNKEERDVLLSEAASPSNGVDSSWKGCSSWTFFRCTFEFCAHYPFLEGIRGQNSPFRAEFCGIKRTVPILVICFLVNYNMLYPIAVMKNIIGYVLSCHFGMADSEFLPIFPGPELLLGRNSSVSKNHSLSAMDRPTLLVTLFLAHPTKRLWS